VLVVEGTYVLGLDDLDVRVFLDATYEDTRERRRARGRDIIDPVIDRILALEHAIIQRQADRADIVIDRDFTIRSTG
jgi:uridine kinase